MSINRLVFPFLGFALALLSTRALISNQRLNVDVPNERSSHTTPTPRGGGAAFIFALIVVVMIIIGGDTRNLLDSKLVAILLGTLGCALLGFAEDLVGLTSKVRFAGQLTLGLAAAIGGVRWSTIDLGFIRIPLKFGTDYLVTVFWFTWLTNLYNFMDGINGIAALNGVVFSSFFAVLAFLSGDNITAWILLTSAATLSGFLVFNFPHAKIFMGDVGSLSLGFFFAGLSILAAETRPSFGLLQASLVLGVFILDATVTLLKRIAGGERITEPHRSHSYQCLARSLETHTAATLIYCFISIAASVIVCCFLESKWLQLVTLLSLIGILIFVLVIQIRFADNSE